MIYFNKGLIRMTLMSKTIYPRFNDNISKEELQKFYLPSIEEIDLARSKVRGKERVYLFLLNLKVFKNLNYFVEESEVPYKITRLVKSKLRIDKNNNITLSEKTIGKYRKDIKQDLNVISDSSHIKNLVIDTVEKYEPLMEK